MAIVVAKIVIDGYHWRQLSSENLRTICSAVGIKPDCHQREGDRLVKKLKLRCKDLQPLLNCTGLESVFGTIDNLLSRFILFHHYPPIVLQQLTQSEMLSRPYCICGSSADSHSIENCIRGRPPTHTPQNSTTLAPVICPD